MGLLEFPAVPNARAPDCVSLCCRSASCLLGVACHQRRPAPVFRDREVFAEGVPCFRAWSGAALNFALQELRGSLSNDRCPASVHRAARALVPQCEDRLCGGRASVKIRRAFRRKRSRSVAPIMNQVWVLLAVSVSAHPAQEGWGRMKAHQVAPFQQQATVLVFQYSLQRCRAGPSDQEEHGQAV